MAALPNAWEAKPVWSTYGHVSLASSCVLALHSISLYFLTTFHLHCLHYLTDYNKGDVLLTFREHLRPEMEGRMLLNLIHIYCNNNSFSCFFNDISLSQDTPKKMPLKYFYSE